MSKPKIIITIDTEVGEKAKFVKDGFEKFILGKIGEEYWGIPKIVEILEKYGIKGEFFVDVYEDAFFGEEKYAKLCQFLNEHGHGVQLHTHPAYAYDINRINMHEYSLEEQIKIIKEGKERIIKWIGKAPIAHRAGNYGANNDTLLALKENDIPIDSSFYFGHPNCKMILEDITSVFYYNGLIEIPVTVIKKRRLLHKLGFKTTFNKIDVNSLNYLEIIKNIKKMKNEKVIVLFGHSFSFINPNRPYYTIIEQNKQLFHDFDNLLHLLSHNYSFISFHNLEIN